jgi:hypothetical protein
VDGLLAVLGLALVLVLSGMAWLWISGRQDQDAAHDRLKQSVELTRTRLLRAAADGTLLGTEIDRAVAGTGKPRADVRRHGRQVTVTALFMGMGGGFGGRTETGCYRLEAVPAADPPTVSAHELPAASCRDRPATSYRDPAAVAADVVAELRAAVARGGLTAVEHAPVWQTYGIARTGQETKDGRLTTLVLLSKGLGSQNRDCYEFRAGRKPVTVTSRKLEPDGCFRIEREREARAEAARRAELEASAERIERRLDRAVTDGRLTNAELARALALPRTDSLGLPAVDDPVAVPVGTERPSAEVIVVAKVNALQQPVWNEGCYEFRNSTSAASAVSTTYGLAVRNRATAGAIQDWADIRGSSGQGPCRYPDRATAKSSPVRGDWAPALRR